MANFDTLKEQIAAALPENTEGAINATIMQAQFFAVIDALNGAKADAFTLALPLAYDGDGALALNYDAYEFDLGGSDDKLTLRLSYGLASNSLGVQVLAGEGLAFDDGAIVPDFDFVQPMIGDLDDIRYNAAHPIHWLGANPVTASEDFIYTGDGTIQPPGEYTEVHFWLVNYTDTAQSIDLLKWHGQGDNPTSITLQPWQVASVTGVYDEQGAQWTIEDSTYQTPPEIFWATYGVTTSAEILAAFNAGKAVMCKYSNRTYILTNAAEHDYWWFSSLTTSSNFYLRVDKANNQWANGSITLQETYLIVSTIIGNETSTTKYTSCKAVYDYVQTAIFGAMSNSY